MMHNTLKLLFILSSLQSFTLSAEDFQDIPKKDQSCLESFRFLLKGNQLPRFIKSRQLNDLQRIAADAKIYEERLVKARLRGVQNDEANIYPFTKNMERDYSAQGEFGISYNSKTNKTTVATFADESLIQEIVVSFYKSPNNTEEPISVAVLKTDGDSRWVAEIDGQMEGLWYQFTMFSHEPAGKLVYSQYGEPIPAEFKSFDITALYNDPIKKFSLAYYPPKQSQRVQAPVSKGSLNILELNLADIRPPDVSKDLWGTPQALTQSQYMWDIIKEFDGVEILPPNDANLISLVSSHPQKNPFAEDLLYLNHWGYMGQSHGYSHRFGGVDSMIDFVDEMHAQGKVVYIDHVFQHSANHMKEWQWTTKKAYCDYDITGCGNTLDLEKGSLPYRVTKQIFQRDLKLIGFDGSRQDLFGAVPRETANELSKLARKWGKRISGEPYGYPYNDSYWNLDNMPLRNSRLWNSQAKDYIRDTAKNGGNGLGLYNHISGGNYFSWKQTSDDATTIIGTHDGQTVASYMDGDLSKIAHATSIQYSAQGDILVGPGHIIGLNHRDLNDSPIDYFPLNKKQKLINDFIIRLTKLRKKFFYFFSEQFIDESEGRVKLLPTPHNESLAIHFKMAPREFRDQQEGQLIVLMNLTHADSTFKLPSGEWQVRLNSRELFVDEDNSINKTATKTFTVPEHATVWLQKVVKDTGN